MNYFVCDMCSHLDTAEQAYPGRLFFEGPPKPWKCTQCQGRDWHGLFPRTQYDGVYPVINRPSPSPVISLG